MTNVISQSSSIAALRKAERQAADKIGEARKRKARRLKQAREDAKGELEAIKAEMEQRFEGQWREEDGKTANYDQVIADMMAQELHKLTEAVRKNERRAVDALIDRVLKIETDLHKNYR